MVDVLIRGGSQRSASVLVAVLRAAMIALLMTFVGPWGANAAPAPPSTPTQVAHDYDAAVYSEATIYTAPERGPPAAYDCTVLSEAVDHVLHGTAARRGSLIARPANGYDGIALLTQVDSPVGTPEQTGRASNGDLYALPASGVAANSVRSAAPSAFTRAEALSGRGSQRTVNEIAESMRTNGWQGAPIDVVELNVSASSLTDTTDSPPLVAQASMSSTRLWIRQP